MSDTLTTSDIADQFGTDGKTLRKFLRSHLPKDELPGQGSRYSFTEDDLDDLRTAYDAWVVGKAKKASAADDEDAEPDATPAPAKAKKGKGKKKAAKPAVQEEIIDDLDDAEPTAEDLEDIDDLELD